MRRPDGGADLGPARICGRDLALYGVEGRQSRPPRAHRALACEGGLEGQGSRGVGP